MSKGATWGGWTLVGILALGYCGRSDQPAPQSQATAPRPQAVVTSSYDPSASVRFSEPAPALPPWPSAPPPQLAPSTPTRQPPAPAQARPVRQERTLYVTGRNVPMKEFPRRDADNVDRLNRGMEVTEVERRNDWVKIRHPITAREGWVSARLLGTVRPADATPAEPQEEQVRTPPNRLTDAAIVALLIAQSRRSYPGNCACPDDTDRAGRRCGARSAHSKPRGRSPLCYPEDVSEAAIAAYRRRR